MFYSREELWDMPIGGTSKEKQIPHWAGNIIWAVLAFLFKIVFRYKVTNKETLRAFNKRCGVLVIANHTSFFDVVFMYLAARPKQWVRFIGRDNLFDAGGGLGGQILSRTGAFPIKRDTADMQAIKRATKHLKNNEAVGILPEGTRRGKSDRVPELHSGAAFIARLAKVPILPMTVRNAENIKRKGEHVRFPKISVEYGQPILLSDFDFLPKAERLDACSWYAMRECFALSKRISPDEVDMVELFPNSKDYTQIFRDNPIPHHSAQDVIAAHEECVQAAAQAKAARIGEERGGKESCKNERGVQELSEEKRSENERSGEE